MRKINDLFKIFAVLITLSSCDELLNLAPEDKIVEDKVFSKEKSAEGALAGTYNLMLEAFKSQYEIADKTAQTVTNNGTVSSLTPFYKGTIATDDATVLAIWKKHYQVINQANMLIYKISNLGNYNKITEKQHIAEALFIRAWSYLNLLMWFGDGALKNNENGLGVVLYLDHYDGFDKNKDIRPRNTNKEVFIQIIKDLEESLKDLPDSHKDRLNTVSRANKISASALLSKVYLIIKDYDNAIKYSNFVLEKYNDLESDLLKVFPPNSEGIEIPFSDEHLFAFPVSGNGGNWQFGGNGINYSYSNYWFSDYLLNLFSPEDLRITKLTKKVEKKLNDNSASIVYVTTKYPNSENRDNLTVMRLPEVMLIKAEALVRKNKSIEQLAIDLINKVHLRSNPQSEEIKKVSFSNYKSLIDRILDEKTKELCWEGIQRFEDIRVGRKLGYYNLPESKLILPIPQREIDITNGVLKQNPSY